MKRIINIGSLNLDKIYQLPHTPLPGETLTASSNRIGLGGKGLNQSIAAARAEAAVIHAGAVGPDGEPLTAALREAGADVSLVRVRDTATGHALILVNEKGNNSIVLSPGANHTLTINDLDEAIGQGHPGDILLLQNETNLIAEAIRRGHAAGLKIAFNFAPFDPQAARELPLELVDILFVNEIEGAGVAGAGDTGRILAILHERYPAMLTVMTRGPEGAFACTPSGEVLHEPSPPEEVVETTAAGDTFIGFFLAELLRSGDLGKALKLGCKAGARCVSRPGAAEAIPTLGEL